jgi:toxin HigB-1
VRYSISAFGRSVLILSFRDSWLRNFYLDDKSSKKLPTGIEERLFRKLQLIDDATCDLDLRSPPSNHFEKLKGNLNGKHSIRVNKQWRLVFLWSGERGEAEDVYLDNHDYR